MEDGSQGARSGEIEPLFDVPSCFPLDVLKSGLIEESWEKGLGNVYISTICTHYGWVFCRWI